MLGFISVSPYSPNFMMHLPKGYKMYFIFKECVEMVFFYFRNHDCAHGFLEAESHIAQGGLRLAM